MLLLTRSQITQLQNALPDTLFNNILFTEVALSQLTDGEVKFLIALLLRSSGGKMPEPSLMRCIPDAYDYIKIKNRLVEFGIITETHSTSFTHIPAIAIQFNCYLSPPISNLVEQGIQTAKRRRLSVEKGTQTTKRHRLSMEVTENMMRKSGDNMLKIASIFSPHRAGDENNSRLNDLFALLAEILPQRYQALHTNYMSELASFASFSAAQPISRINHFSKILDKEYEEKVLFDLLTSMGRDLKKLTTRAVESTDDLSYETPHPTYAPTAFITDTSVQQQATTSQSYTDETPFAAEPADNYYAATNLQFMSTPSDAPQPLASQYSFEPTILELGVPEKLNDDEENEWRKWGWMQEEMKTRTESHSDTTPQTYNSFLDNLFEVVTPSPPPPSLNVPGTLYYRQDIKEERRRSEHFLNPYMPPGLNSP